MREKLRQIRESQGFTQETFSQFVNISRSHYSQIEQGSKWPSYRLAMRIKDALGCEEDDLFDNTVLSQLTKNEG